MTEITCDSALIQTEQLLNHYGFDLTEYTAKELINRWLEDYNVLWLRLAVVEALYQGRYKAVSVQQILYFWSRKGSPTFHFNHEFERLICRKLPRYLSSFADAVPEELTENEGLMADNWRLPEIMGQINQKTTENLSLAISAEAFINLEKTITETNNQENNGDKLIINPPIHQFSPSPDASEFYQKLKAVARQSLA